MSNEEKTYSAEFKAKVAQEAIEQDKENLDRLSDKYDVPVSTILTWTVQYEKDPELLEKSEEQPDSAADTGQTASDREEVEVEVSDREIAESMSYGVMFDNLNIRRLIFWSVLGIVLVLIFIFSLREMYQYNRLISQEAASESTEFYQANQQKKEDTETLNSFGVVDLENGIYRIPIDSAINEMAEEAQ